MKKEYIKPNCVEQVLKAMNFLLASKSIAGGDKPKPGSAPARRTEPF